MYKMITILGPTASGKTTVATTLAKAWDAEIISADSRQVYRRMDIGTGKDLSDYTVDGVQIPYHLIDIVEPGEKYNLHRYQQDFHRAYDEIRARGKNVILCGGTGLYIEAVLKGYNLPDVGENKELRLKLQDKSLQELTDILEDLKARNGSLMHNTTDVDTAQRAIRAIEIEDYILRNSGGDTPVANTSFAAPESLIVGIDIDRDERRAKITKRLDARLDEGMVDEVRSLLSEGIPAEDLIYYGLEYKYVTEYIIGTITYDEMRTRLEIAIHQFAKRQMTWFRGMERRGFKIHWISSSLPLDEKIARILELYKGES